MQLISVNIGEERSIGNVKSGTSGIFKQPTSAAIQVTRLGLVGDVIIDVKHHGGPDQAVYVYTAPDYAWWSQALGRPVEPGTFGDNLTVSELESAQTRIGDRLHIGDVILEVTAARIPCATLAARMGDPEFVKRFRAAERPGLYCRVIQEGPVQVGQAVRYLPFQGETITTLEMFREFYDPDLSEAVIRRHLAAPVALRDRVRMEEKLQKLLAQG